MKRTERRRAAARRTRTAEDDGLDPPLGRRTDEGGGKRGARQSERVKAMDGTGTDGERERGEWERRGRERGTSQNAGSFNMADAS